MPVRDISNFSDGGGSKHVIAMAYRYGGDVHMRFLGSLKESGFRGNVHLICLEHDMKQIKNIKNIDGLDLHFYTDVSHINDDVNKLNPNNARLSIQADILKNLDKNDKVIICDYRDLIFQKDPLSLIENGKAYLTTEDQLIGKCGFNGGWVGSIDKVFDTKMLEKMDDSPIICVGIILGTVGKVYPIMKLLDEKVKEYYTKCENRNIPCEKYMDQGMINYLYFGEKNIDAVLIGNDSNITNNLSQTFHLGIFDEEKQFSKNGGHYTNKKGEIVACVHQYDRAPDRILNILREKRTYPV